MTTNILLADKAFYHIIKHFSFTTVLDVGCGSGEHATLFKEMGKEVTTIDVNGSYNPTLKGEIFQLPPFKTFDCIWCSHVLEHQLNVNRFLKCLNDHLKEEGVLAITVPPFKAEVVGGHVTIWNAGLLLYNLVLAEFDCNNVTLMSYGYNISVILKKYKITLPPLIHDHGDIKLLRDFLPRDCTEGIDGCLNDI